MHDPSSPNYVVVRARFEIVADEGKTLWAKKSNARGINATAANDYLDLIERWAIGKMKARYGDKPYREPDYWWRTTEQAVQARMDAYHAQHNDKLTRVRGCSRVDGDRHIIEVFLAMTFAAAEDAEACRRVIAMIPVPNEDLL